ncbi:hypothetical protein KQX54_016663 [Cotesia glomerata]|uniref:Uncharacterized protein n=1 Tax=Cotesia glomerata TaxID=32391 RepID=A0AAV7J867_COTGL|nr:hypothetical protein KQX54_016663 [Cotesia glomerata]
MVQVLPNKKISTTILAQAIRQKEMRLRVYKLVEGYWPEKSVRSKLVFDHKKKGKKITTQEVKDIMSSHQIKNV